MNCILLHTFIPNVGEASCHALYRSGAGFTDKPVCILEESPLHSLQSLVHTLQKGRVPGCRENTMTFTMTLSSICIP